MTETLREALPTGWLPAEGETLKYMCQQMQGAIRSFIENRITGAVDAIVAGGLKLI
jgi:hypothetical protein